MSQTLSPYSEDDELMRQVVEGSSEALDKLVERWQKSVYSFVYRGVRNADDAEELTQETFWRLWRAREQYQSDGRFTAWLFRIASRLCIDHYRRQSRRPTLVSSEHPHFITASAQERPDQDMVHTELAQALDDAIAQLPVNQRLALQMNRFEGLSYREIAEALDCSLGSVEQLIYRARRRLRRDLACYLPQTLRLPTKSARTANLK